MVVTGIMHTVAYLVSGRGKNRLTDTALVEGLVTFCYGFAVLNNQITDEVLTLFFGTWLTVCGITRISQSFYVSRFNPRDWAKIMPLGMVAAMFGVIMMMPSLLSAVMPLMLIGGAFIVNGFSILIYAMYMRRKDADRGKAELEARQRAEAKKQLQKTKREQRDKLRSLSQQEREEAQAKLLADQRAYENAKKEEKLARRRARKEAVAVQLPPTIQLSKEEVEEIVAGAPAEQLAEDAEVAENIIVKAAELEAASKVSFKIPETIPSIRLEDRPTSKKKKTETAEPVKIAAVNLEEIERPKEVSFEKVELPEVKLASDSEKVSRQDVLSKISSVSAPKADNVDYTPIDLDDLVTEPLEKPLPKDDSKRFTQVLSINWKES